MIDFNLIPVLPEMFLAMAAMGLLVVGVAHGNGSTQVVIWACVSALVIAACLLFGMSWERQVVLNGMFVFDNFAGYMKLLVILGLVTALAISGKYLELLRMNRFEYPVLIVLAGIGMMLMISSNNLLALYMGLELQSLSLYVLAAFNRNSLRAAEAGIKYFILGALSSGMLLFGISLIYGYTGSIDYGVIGATLSGLSALPFGVIFGLVFILAGLAFKVSAVPFHMWTPDVYQGAPTSVTALFAIVPKVAAIALLMRLLFEPFAAAQGQWVQIVYFLSLASMIVGAFGAIAQTNLKRLFAYSSIGNMGYALIGIVAGTPEGAGAVILYMLIYMVMTAGVFAIIIGMRHDGIRANHISDLSGISATNPVLAYAMAIFMFSMSGIPPLAGFFGKLFIFQSAVAEQYYILATLGILTSVVAAFYYLKIVKVMFFDESVEPFEKDIPFARRVVLFVAVAFLLAFIFRPEAIVNSAQSAAASLFI